MANSGHRRAKVVLSALVLSLGSVASAQKSADIPDPSVRVPVPLRGAPAIGADDALVTIVEFSDFYCPHCRRANDTLATLLRIYPSQIRVVYRHSLLDAKRGAMAAEASLAAAARGKFWPFHDRLFAGPAPTSIDELAALAGEVGLDVEEIRAELVARTHRPRLADDLEMAEALGIRGVPFFFVNGRPLSGAQPISVFARIIDEEIALAERVLASGSSAGGIYAAMLKHKPDDVQDPAIIFRRGLDPDKTRHVSLGRESHRQGGSEPLVTIVEFSDYTCGYCRRAHPDLLAMLRQYGDDLRIVYRHFPLGSIMKPVAQASEEAAAQGKFWEFTDRVFSPEGSQHATRKELAGHARAVGLDVDAFERALDEHTHARTVAEDALDAARLGVTGTPTLFINGRAVLGAPPIDALRQMIEEELAAARELLGKGVERGAIYNALCNRSSQSPN